MSSYHFKKLNYESEIFKIQGFAPPEGVIQGVAPPEAWKSLSSELDYSGLRCGAILALAVHQVCFGGQETRIRARKGSGLA